VVDVTRGGNWRNDHGAGVCGGTESTSRVDCADHRLPIRRYIQTQETIRVGDQGRVPAAGGRAAPGWTKHFLTTWLRRSDSFQVASELPNPLGDQNCNELRQCSVQPLRSLCLCGGRLTTSIHPPQRHREHGGNTEKTGLPHYCHTQREGSESAI
jgi:hypothetical protein